MRAEVSIEDKLLLELLSEELQGKQTVKSCEKTGLQQLFFRAERHRVLALLYNRIEVAEIAEVEKKMWLEKTKSAVLQSYHLLFTAKYVVELLEENGIPCVLLKGVTIASCYPMLCCRKPVLPKAVSSMAVIIPYGTVRSALRWKSIQDW